MYILGSGFIGSSIKKEFEKSDLISLRNQPKNFKLNKHKIFIICCGISRLVKNDSSILQSEIKKIDWILNNIDKKEVRKVILFSTIDLYSKKKLKINEETNTEVSDYYSLTQLLYEKSMISKFQKKLLILRLTGVYGELDKNNSTISKMINQALYNNQIVLSNTFNIKRDYIYIDDLIQILKKILKKNCHGIVNIGSFKSKSILSYAKLVSKYTGSKILIKSNNKNKRVYNVTINGDRLNSIIGLYSHNHENNIKNLIGIKR